MSDSIRQGWVDHYTQLAWQDGDVSRQSAWRFYVNGALLDLESEFPGIRSEVAERMKQQRGQDG